MNSALHAMYYIAVVCPTRINDVIAKHKRWMKDHFGCTVAMKSPAHITLVAPFWFSLQKEDQLQHALDALPLPQTAIEVEINGFDHFGKRVLFASLEENDRLAGWQALVDDFFTNAFPADIKKELRPFHPHITIANRDLRPSDFDIAWEFFSRQTFNDKFTVEAISLLKLQDGKWQIAKRRTLPG